MKKDIEDYKNKITSKRAIFLSTLLICLGVILASAQLQSSIGIVLIAIGGLFFIIGMAYKKKSK